MGFSVEKTREERLAEGIEVLKQLIGFGISKEEPGYIATQSLIGEWVKDGKAVDEKIEFPRYGRVLEISLPRKNNRVASAVFKVRRVRL